MTNKTKPNDPYAKAGVNIETGNKLISLIKKSVNDTHNKNVLNGIGGFAGFFELSGNYKKPVLVGCTDGVGTKVSISKSHNKLKDVGQDLVAMCVNDMAACGAKPLFFLDYFATSKLDLKESSQIIQGIAKACKKLNVALLGGETAEMPGHYKDDNFDLAGFAVGVIEKSKIIDGTKIKKGQILLGIESSGPHSNGYSLIRKILSRHKPPTNILRAILNPTILYTNVVSQLQKYISINGIAHITGGGITENMPRILSSNLSAVIDLQSWKQPKVFEWLKSKGKISDEDMLKIFNCGIGMIIVINKKDIAQSQSIIKKNKLKSYVIGEVISSPKNGIVYS
tara:strand:+ start:4535 stop:5551 length:1017 start_codon:yes stop_codon:yes gene_type:complete